MMATVTELPDPLGLFNPDAALIPQCNQPDQVRVFKAQESCWLKPPDTRLLSRYQPHEVPQVSAFAPFLPAQEQQSVTGKNLTALVMMVWPFSASPAAFKIAHCLLSLWLIQIVLSEQNGAVDIWVRFIEIELFFQLWHATLECPVRLNF